MTCGPGTITHALFAIPESNAPRDFPLLRRHIASVVQNLGGARKHFVVVCPPGFPSPEDWCPDNQGSKLSVLRATLPPEAIWIQDPLLTAASSVSGRKRLVLSVALKRWPAWTAAIFEAAEMCGLDVEVADFPFSGGNLLQGTSNSLVGLDLIHRIGRWMGVSTDRACAKLSNILGVDVIPIGAASNQVAVIPSCPGIGFQPLFHLDHFVTRTGLAGKNGREIVFVGHPAKTQEVLGSFGNEVTRQWASTSPMHVCEDQLKAHFDVRRLPIMIVRGRLGSSMRKERTYLLAFNNCVIDVSPSGDTKVLLPSFHQDSFLYDTDAALRKELEAAAAGMWQEIGVEVRFSDGVEDLAYQSGGIHCMSKVLRRAEAPVRQLALAGDV